MSFITFRKMLAIIISSNILLASLSFFSFDTPIIHLKVNQRSLMFCSHCLLFSCCSLESTFIFLTISSSYSNLLLISSGKLCISVTVLFTSRILVRLLFIISTFLLIFSVSSHVIFLSFFSTLSLFCFDSLSIFNVVILESLYTISDCLLFLRDSSIFILFL